MRSIKFRGKRVANGEFVFGSYVYEKDVENYKENSLGEMVVHETYDSHSIYSSERTSDGKFWCDVLPESVGQFTGLLDKNDVEIYSGDLFKDNRGRLWIIADIDCGQVVMQVREYIAFEKHGYGMVPIFEAVADLQTMSYLKGIEVIGNIHESPEIMEVSK